MSEAKPYTISKNAVMIAYQRVKANRGAPGIDGQTIAEFEKDLKGNLYKIWNRMSSGSYFPPSVKAVEIPKADGKKRKLGIPTVGDRIAQTVVKLYLEPRVEPHFHENSYGYRPNKSGLEAVKVARERCWKYDWVIDIDIKGFFDNIDHELTMRAVNKHAQEEWIRLYVQRWLEAPIQEVDGTIRKRDRGTPQGGVISPILANLFLHYAFDNWMEKNYPICPFERYADDIVVHCKTEEEAIELLGNIKGRLQQCKLELHPDKTKIVYCKDSNRNKKSDHEKFDFLGYTFRPRSSRNRMGKLFTNFSPAMSDKAKTKAKEEMKSLMREVKPNDSLESIAKKINPIYRGWENYYGKFYNSSLWTVVQYINLQLMIWAKRKHEQLGRHWRKVRKWLDRRRDKEPTLFVHWKWMQAHGLNGRAV